MPNPFYTPSNGGNSDPIGFIRFMNSMRGQNPQNIINNLVSSGKINQQQLNVVQQKARQVSGLFEGFRGMFGF